MDPPAGVLGHRVWRRPLLAGAALLALLGVLAASVLLGSADLPPAAVLAALVAPDSADPLAATVVWSFRLPSTAMAVLVGASLGLAGAVMQTVLANPLASPYTMGVSSAAGCGAALAIVAFGSLGLSQTWTVPVSAFAGALLCTAAIAAMARWLGRGREALVLGGIGLLFLFNALTALLQYVSSEQQLQAIVFWLFGSLEGATWPQVAVLGGILALVAPLVAADAWRLTALGLGEEHARALGVDLARLRLRMLAAISLLTAAAVCFTGSIAFVGLVAPHAARLLVGGDQRLLLPISALAGVLLLAGAGLAARLLIPGSVFPIGIATAIIGVPAFMLLVFARMRRRPC